MRIRNGTTPIPMPPIVDDPRWIGRFSRDVRKSIAALRDRTPVGFSSPASGGSDTLPPFHVELVTTGSGESLAYFVTVTDGRVTDRVPIVETNALIFHQPGNIYDEEGELEQHAITVGDTVCVKVEVLPTGEIGHESLPEADWVTIVVGNGTAIESTHYVPPVADDDEGTAGTYFYHLAKLEAGTEEGDPPILTRILSGSHIDHFRERPMMDNGGTGANVLKDYDAENDVYRFRRIRGTGNVTITQNENDIEIEGTSGEHLDLFAVTMFYELEDGYIKPTGSSEAYLHRWRYGLYVGRYAVNYGPLPGDDALTIIEQYVTYLDGNP